MTSIAKLIEKAALAVCASAVFLMMVIGALDIVMGNTVGWFLSFKVELSGTLLASCIFLACGPVQRASEHIRVDLLEPYMPAQMLRLRNIAALLCGCLVIGLIAYGLWQQAFKSALIFEASADTSGFPIWPWKLACAVGATLCSLTLLAQLAAALRPGEKVDSGKSL